MPNYRETHIGLFGVLLLTLFVISPLVLSVVHNMSPWGPLAYSLSLSGCLIVASLLSRGVFMIPAMAIFFSSYAEQTHWFWFGDNSAYTLLHLALTLTGAAMIGYCLWYLAQLTEEMDEYQIMPMGGVQLSRVERAEQRRLIATQMKKQKLMARLSDNWLDRLINNRSVHRTMEFTELGFARVSSLLSTFMTCLGFTLYALILMQLDFMRIKSEQYPNTMFLIFALAIPAATAGMALMQHRQRMGQELLRPASRTDYVDKLLAALTKRSLLLWLGSHTGLGLVAYFTGSYPSDNTFTIIFEFLTLSLATAVPSLGLSVRMGLWKSYFGYMLGMYAVVALQMGTLHLWWDGRMQQGPALVILLTMLHLALGAALIAWARRCWLKAELA